VNNALSACDGLAFRLPGAKTSCANQSGGSMLRREALKLLFAGGILPAVPADLFGFFQDSHPPAGYALWMLIRTILS